MTDMNIGDSVRQGDVLIRKVAELPKALKPVKPTGRGLVLMEGEATGHAHTVSPEKATLYRDSQARMFLNVALAGCFVAHEEHARIELAPGVYEVIGQRRFDYAELAESQVVD